MADMLHIVGFLGYWLLFVAGASLVVTVVAILVVAKTRSQKNARIFAVALLGLVIVAGSIALVGHSRAMDNVEAVVQSAAPAEQAEIRAVGQAEAFQIVTLALYSHGLQALAAIGLLAFAMRPGRP